MQQNIYKNVTKQGTIDAKRLFVDVYDLVKNKKFLSVVCDPDSGESKKILPREKARLLKKYVKDVDANSGIKGAHKSLVLKANRNKNKIGNVMVKSAFTSVKIGLSVGVVIATVTGPETLGFGILVAPVIGVGVAIGSIPVQIGGFFVKKSIKHVYRHAKYYKKADRYVFNIRQEMRAVRRQDTKVTPTDLRAVEKKFRHKHLSKLVDNWSHIRTSYLLGKAIEAPINEVISRGYYQKEDIPIVCHDFAIAAQFLYSYHNVYNRIDEQVIMFDEMFQYVDRKMGEWTDNYLKILMDTVKKIRKFEKSFDLESYGAAVSKNPGMLKQALEFHAKECRNSSLTPKAHRICYVNGGTGKGYFSLSEWRKKVPHKSAAEKKKARNFEKLYNENMLVRILEDVSHSKQYKPHFSKADLLHVKKRHNPRYLSMAEESAQLLGCLDLEALCDPLKGDRIARELKAAIKKMAGERESRKLAEQMVKNVAISVRELTYGTMGQVTGDALNGDLVKALATEIKFIASGLDGDFDEEDGAEVIAEVAEAVSGKLIDVLSTLITNAFSDDGGFAGWEMLSGFFDPNPIGDIVSDVLEKGFSADVNLDIAALIVGGLEIGYDTIVFPAVEFWNKKLNLKNAKASEDYQLIDPKQRPAGGKRGRINVDKNRLRRIADLRALFKSNEFMDHWIQEYKTLNQEFKALKKKHSQFRPNNCYNSYDMVRQLLIFRKQYQTVKFYHRYISEFNYGVTSKSRRMALKNSLRFHRLYKNAEKYFSNQNNSCTISVKNEKNEYGSAICYHMHPQGPHPKTVNGDDQTGEFSATEIDTKMAEIFKEMYLFGESEASNILKKSRKISNPDYAKTWEKEKQAIVKTTHDLMLKGALGRRREAMGYDHD